MADVADKANDHIELERRGLLAQRKPEAPAASGGCLYCHSLLPRGQRWCDSSCRDDYEKEHGS